MAPSHPYAPDSSQRGGNALMAPSDPLAPARALVFGAIIGLVSWAAVILLAVVVA